MTPLRDLDARFIRLDEHGGRWIHAGLKGAHGVMFQCPKCAEGKPRGAEGDRRFAIGAHYIMCWFRGCVPDDFAPKPGRWNPSGTDIDDLSFVGPGLCSVQLLSGCGWHGHVRDGAAG